MAKKTETRRTPPNRTGEPVNVWVRKEIMEAFRAYLEASEPRVSKTAAIEAAMIAFLKERGFWGK